MHAAVGVDVGGTRTKGVALGPDGTVLVETGRPTPHSDTAARLGPFVGDMVDELTRGVDASSVTVGVAVPGLVDESRGIGVWSANLGWRDLDLVDVLAPHLNAPFTIGHDVRTGLLGEQRLGAARGHDDVCFIAIGTGLAAAVMSGGNLVRGGPWTGEIGHVTLDPRGPLCGCGRHGCLETFIGGSGLARRWREATGTEADAREIVGRADAGDRLAADLWSAGIDALATVLAPVLLATGVELVVVGGGISQAGRALLDPLGTGLRDRLGDAPVQAVPAQLGDRAAALGAAILGRENA